MAAKKYQIIKKTMVAGTNPTISIDTTTDKRYKRVTELAVITDADYTLNKNLEVVSPIQINGEEIIPVGFDTMLLYPRLEYKAFRKFTPIEAEGSRVECRLQYNGTLGDDLEVKIILTLEEEA